MKRNHLYWATSLLTYAVVACIIDTYFIHDVAVTLVCSIPGIIFGIPIGSALDKYISSRFPGFLYTPNEDLVRMAQDRQEKREKLQSTMLFKMQYMQGIERTIAEPQRDFQK